MIALRGDRVVDGRFQDAQPALLHLLEGLARAGVRALGEPCDGDDRAVEGALRRDGGADEVVDRAGGRRAHPLEVVGRRAARSRSSTPSTRASFDAKW